jgi:phage baseplate assembly protein gpV
MKVASTRVSSSLALALALAACVDREAPISGTQSLRVTVLSPADTGGPTNRLADDARDIVFQVEAIDAKGQVDRTFSGSVDVRVFSQGTVDPLPKPVVIQDGEGDGQTLLPPTFGQTYLWVEDARTDGDRPPTFATGTSPILWYRDPTLEDVSKPGPGQNVLYDSPLAGKQVNVSVSKFGDAGKLVVTGVYATGFTVSDVTCAAGPCAGYPFGHVFVYTYSLPRDDARVAVKVGQTVSYVSGGVSEFNGYTELNFPQTHVLTATPDEALVPAPVAISSDWLLNTAAMASLEQVEAGLVSVENVTVCSLDSDYTRFGQWKVNIGLGCGKPMNVVTQGQVNGFDPTQHVGMPIRRIVGTLRGVNFSSFNVWIVQPRSAADITLE